MINVELKLVYYLRFMKGLNSKKNKIVCHNHIEIQQTIF